MYRSDFCFNLRAFSDMYHPLTSRTGRGSLLPVAGKVKNGHKVKEGQMREGNGS